MKRTIIFGDIHGCLEEWVDLMEKIGATEVDRLISVGDLICRGPASARTLDFAMNLPNFECVLGNHELRFLTGWRQGRIPNLKSYDLATAWDMSERFDEYMRFLDSKPFYLDLPEALIIHAGLRPGIALGEQSPRDLTEVREIGDDLKPWYELYRGEKPVIFGHWVRREPLVLKNVIGLDTGCVYGGKLSAYVLPEAQVISVPARKVYWVRSKPWA